jgi:hypothetical protein
MKFISLFIKINPVRFAMPELIVAHAPQHANGTHFLKFIGITYGRLF